MIEEKQRMQTLNILNTVIEATNHFTSLIKVNNINKSIFIISSITEGIKAIEYSLASSNLSEAKKERENIQNCLLLIVKELERGNKVKILEIIQFSFLPLLKNLKKQIENSISETYLKKIYTIGVYLSNVNPRYVISEMRLKALIRESQNQSVELYFFSSDDVNMEKKEINADFYSNGEWFKKMIPYPDVINNINIESNLKHSKIERILRKEIPFTSFGIGNKFTLPKRIVESRKYAELLVPFRINTDLEVIYNFFKTNKRAVFKPIFGRRGENIYFIEKKSNHFSILDHKKKFKLNIEEFSNWLDKNIMNHKGNYLIQQYVNCRTNKGEPYDIRAHVQKNGEGKWQITRIYPRIGNKKSILSNISRGGRSEAILPFFEEEFGINRGRQLESEISELSMGVTNHIDKLYGLSIDELGLDLAIDKDGRFWLHEVNNGPQTTFHEEKRAVNTIAYALYIAKNRIFHTNQYENLKSNKNSFYYKSSDIPTAKLDDRTNIGMLIDPNDKLDLAVACSYVSAYEKVNFFYFSPNDIDYDEMLIKGYFYENNNWVAKVVEYPDVIYDRLRLRGYRNYNLVYSEFEGIPFTNEFFGNSISKLEVYDKFKYTGKFNDFIIPYQAVSRLKDIFNFLQTFNAIIIKPEVGSFAIGVHYVTKKSVDKYQMVVGNKKYNYDEIEMTRYLRDLLKNGKYIVQQYINTRTKDEQPFDIRVHLMKDGNGMWSCVNAYPRIGINYATISSTGNGGYIGEIQGFLDRNFSKENGKQITKKIQDLSLSVAKEFEKLFEKNLGEMGLDIAIDKDMHPFLIEVNINKPGIIYYEFEVAKHAIQYAKYLTKSQK